jgi:hypothetical protein
MDILNSNDSETDISEKQSHDRLIDGQDIRFKTEITYEQRGIISCIETSIKHFKNKNIILYVASNFVLSYIDMGANIDRKSRKEVVEALKAKSEFIEKEQIMAKQNAQMR